jgi:hypothetical protein
MYNINLNYVKLFENTDVKVLPIFEISKLKVVLCLVQFLKTYARFAGGGIVSRYIIECFLSTILYNVIRWLLTAFPWYPSYIFWIGGSERNPS